MNNIHARSAYSIPFREEPYIARSGAVSNCSFIYLHGCLIFGRLDVGFGHIASSSLISITLGCSYTFSFHTLYFNGLELYSTSTEIKQPFFCKFGFHSSISSSLAHMPVRPPQAFDGRVADLTQLGLFPPLLNCLTVLAKHSY